MRSKPAERAPEPAHAPFHSHDRFIALFERAAEGIAVCDRDGRFTLVNERYCQLVGRSREQLLQMQILDVVHPQDASESAARTRTLFEHGEVHAHEKRFVRPDGTVVWVHAEVSRVADASGSAIAYLAVCQDITESRRAEALLFEQHALLALVAAGRPLDECLRALCKSVSRLAAGVRAAVLICDGERNRIERAISHDLPSEFVRALAGARIAEDAIGPCAQAIRRNEFGRCADVDRGPYAGPWRTLCAAHAIRGCFAQPVGAADGSPIASFLLVVEAPRGPSEWERRLAIFGAYVASIAIERDRSDRAIRESEERYRTLFESIDDGLCVLEMPDDDEVRIVEINPAFEALVGNAAHDPTTSLDLPPLGPDCIDRCREVARTGRAARFEQSDPDERAWFEVNAFRFGDAQQRKIAIVFRDITERRSREMRDRYLLRLSDALRPIGDPGTIKREATRVLGEELRAHRVLYAESDPEHMHVNLEDGYCDDGTRIHGSYCPAQFGAPVLDALLAGRAYVNEDIAADPRLDADAKALWARLGAGSVIVAPLREGGHLVSSLGVHASTPRRWHPDEILLVEHTAQATLHAVERARAEAALREDQQRKDEFLATLGHELRAPLSPIRNAVQLLRYEAKNDTRASAAHEMIERQVQQMARLLEDLLDVSRISTGKMRLRTERIDLVSAVERAIEAVRADIEARRHSLHVSMPQERIAIDADPARLVQIVANLLGNASKYTDRGGRIDLAVEPSQRNGQPHVRVRVRDNGIGIANEFLPRLFVQFSQAQSALEHSQGGLGLGLALVRRLVEMHGGAIHARSEGLGRGSEFVVELPVSEPFPATEAPASDPEPTRPVAGGARRTLVVDDNPDNAESLALLMRLHGDEVETAHDGLEAIEIAERFRPDVVLLDIGMPKMNGYETCRTLRERPWGRHAIIVAQTGWGQNEDRERAQLAGFDAHLVKPIEFVALTEMLAALDASRVDRADDAVGSSQRA